MTRKTTIITLCILGAVGAIGSCVCCSGIFDNPSHTGSGHVRHTSSRRFMPIFFGGGSSHSSGTSHVGSSSSTSRGGFGASSGSHGGSVGA